MPEQTPSSLGPEYFEQVYAAYDDPWQFATSPYERAKYADTLQHLPRARYLNALEVGRSIGVLTARLAPRCNRLLAIDVSERALEQARTRYASLRNVQFARMEVPSQEPEGRFDLVLVSEIGYYYSRADLDRVIAMVGTHQEPGDQLISGALDAGCAGSPAHGRPGACGLDLAAAMARAARRASRALSAFGAGARMRQWLQPRHASPA